MTQLRSLLYVAAKHQFEFTVTYISTNENTIPDAVSRLDFHKFWKLAPHANPVMTTPLPVPGGW